MKTSRATVTKVLKHEQNKELSEFTFWVDNCSAQNKNWTLMSAMISEINAAESNVGFIKFKYFEKGHTFMAADSWRLHHQVEEAIKQRKYLYNFDDFVSAVKSKGKVDVMLPVDYFNYTKELSYGKKGGIKYPLLADIREAMFKKGSYKIILENRYARTRVRVWRIYEETIQAVDNKRTSTCQA